MPRFFVPRAELGENFLVLTGENAAHARVLRLKNGDAVTVCDGEGEEWHCVVSDVAPGQVSLVVQEHTAAKSEAAVFCSVYMAFAKADKFEHVIQKATELGAAELVAFPSARCVSRPDERSLAKKLERWQNIILRRPDPQAVWKRTEHAGWNRVHAHYHRSNRGGGSWEFKQAVPETWTVSYKELTFKVSPTGFKHTGLFPEQAVNWDWMQSKIRKAKAARRPVRILNLFAYTGGATMACASAGADEVVHVDASKGMVQWAKENMALSHLENRTIRFIVDDVLKFVAREKRRGHTYQGILMDPPSYGRGPNGEVWKLEDQINELVNACLEILDDDALFLLVNSYTTGFSSIVLENILRTTVLRCHPNGYVFAGEVGLPITQDHMILPCGIYGAWSDEDDEVQNSL